MSRVEGRTRLGGHHVPHDVVTRRYERSAFNFVNVYLPIVSGWRVYDGSGRPEAGGLPLVAHGVGRRIVEVRDARRWRVIGARLSLLREVADMEYTPDGPKPLDTEEGALIDKAMNRAFYEAVKIHRMHGVPMVLWIDEEVRHVDPWEIPLPEESRDES